MFDVKIAIADIENRAKRRGVPIRRICASAKVAPSNWNRWKTGTTSPTFETWARIDRAVTTLLAEVAA